MPAQDDKTHRQTKKQLSWFLAGCLAAALAMTVIAALFGASDLRLTPEEELKHAEVVERHARERVEEFDQRLIALVEKIGQTPAERTLAGGSESPLHDDEWQEFPRLGFSVPEAIALSPNSLDPRELYRHTKLNPQDAYIDKKAREAFELSFHARAADLAKLREFAHQSSMAEMGVLIEKGLARGVSIDKYRESLSAEEQREWEEAKERTRKNLLEAGLSEAEVRKQLETFSHVNLGKAFPFQFFATRIQNGTYYAAALRELPRTASSMEVYKVYVADFANYITNLFVSSEVLMTRDAVDIVDATIRELDKTYPTTAR